jgi:hypothetical protein
MTAYMFITSQKQGKFQGEGAGEWKNWIPVLALTMELDVPTDPATGQVSGKRLQSANNRCEDVGRGLLPSPHRLCH